MSFVWELCSAVTSEYTEDGFLGIQIDGIGLSEAGQATQETLAPLGFLARPQDPDADGAARTFLISSGDDEFTFPVGDSRAARLIPVITKGSSVQYAVRKGFELLSFDLHDGETGTKTAYIEYLDGGTKKAHILTMGLDANGVPFTEFLHGDGMGFTAIERVAMMRNAPGNVYVSVDDNGATINGNTTVNGSLTVIGDVSANGDVKASANTAAVSLKNHPHPTAMGPSGPPTPTP